MRIKLPVWIAAIAVLLAVTPLLAHHSFAAEYDGTKQVNLRGKVSKVEWINPHAWLYVDVKSDDGKVVNWAVELGPPNALIKRGWNKKSVPIGVELLIEGYRSKDGESRVNGREITFPDGTKLFAGSSGTGTPDEAPAK
jgi:hypothetical protein